MKTATRTVPAADPFGVSMFDTDTTAPGAMKGEREETMDKTIIAACLALYPSRSTIADLKPAVVAEVARVVFEAMARKGFRLHKDHPRCGRCLEEEALPILEQLEWLESRGVAVANAMHEKNLRDSLAWGENEKRKAGG